MTGKRADEPVLDWFREWLAWSHLPEAERGEMPQPPSRVDATGRVQETVCAERQVGS